MDMNIFEEGFSASVLESSLEPLKLTQEKWCDVSDAEQQFLRSRAMSSTGIGTETQLRKRIAEFIQVMSLDNVPLKLVTINRRFARIASKVGTSTAAIVQQLQMAGMATMMDSGGVHALYANAVWEEKMAFRKLNGVTDGNLLRELMANAQ